MQLTSLYDYLHDMRISTPACQTINGYSITPTSDSDAQIDGNIEDYSCELVSLLEHSY